MSKNGQIATEEGESNMKSILEMIVEMQLKAKLPFFKGILPHTLPIVFYTSDVTEPYFAYGIFYCSQPSFRTCYFRIEDVTDSLVRFSLLYPTDIEGNYIDNMQFPFSLKRTESKVTIPLKDFCSIQCINPNLIDRQVIIPGDK